MKEKQKICYLVNAEITPEDVSRVFIQSGISRPSNDIERLQRMIENADIIVTAWIEDKMIGIARAITDFSYCCYLSDLAVDKAYQHSGIGRKLIQMVQEKLGDEVSLILLAAPSALEYYPHIGFEQLNNGFGIKRKK